MLKGEKDQWPGVSPSQAAYLTGYAGTGRFACAAKLAKVTKRTGLRWRKLTEGPFAEAWPVAESMAVEYLRDVAAERAVEVERPSDQILMFLLKSYDRGRFGDQKRVEHSGNVGVTQIRLVDEESDDADSD